MQQQMMMPMPPSAANQQMMMPMPPAPAPAGNQYWNQGPMQQSQQQMQPPTMGMAGMQGEMPMQGMQMMQGGEIGGFMPGEMQNGAVDDEEFVDDNNNEA
eukprot:TRINITY_DN0_c1843_g1_i3.p2 TRINITY_DN0_c1843_g1~~TRINITY_DN0_c1843_g1_i3.p2  ORF type:complete len:100 (+),score=28.60 TRINITY_DN0_c1843_g1_i3:3-302(+)